jgi:hypothetical protein
LPKLNQAAKIFIAVTLFSLIVYLIYVLFGSFTILFGYFAGLRQDVAYVRMTGPVFWFGFVGLGARFTAAVLGLASIFLLYVKSRTFSKIKVVVASALFLEGLFFLSETPSVWFLLRPGLVGNLPLAINYALLVLLTVPFLWVLTFKVATYRNGKASLLKFSAVTFVAYVVALAVNQVSRWTSMISAGTLGFLFEGIHVLGFLDAVVLMPLAVVLAVVGAFRLTQQNIKSAMLWMGACLATVGLNYSIYVIYSYFAESLNSLPLVDVWTIPLLGLGIALIIKSRKTRLPEV